MTTRRIEPRQPDLPLHHEVHELPVLDPETEKRVTQILDAAGNDKPIDAEDMQKWLEGAQHKSLKGPFSSRVLEVIGLIKFRKYSSNFLKVMGEDIVTFLARKQNPCLLIDKQNSIFSLVLRSRLLDRGVNIASSNIERVASWTDKYDFVFYPALPPIEPEKEKEYILESTKLLRKGGIIFVNFTKLPREKLLALKRELSKQNIGLNFESTSLIIIKLR